MAYKVKGIFKVISRIFAVKEHEIEMEIGYPTDVKHVAHIGWDSAAGNASPSWMNDIMASSDFSSLGTGNFAASTGTSWVSQDLERQLPVGAVSENAGRQGSATCPVDVPRAPRKPGRKKPKDGSPTRLSVGSADEVASPPSPAADAEVAANAAR